MGKKAWLVGVASCNTNVTDKADKWLNLVLYISFRSKPSFAWGQFVEMPHAIEASNHSFIWVV